MYFYQFSIDDANDYLAGKIPSPANMSNFGADAKVGREAEAAVGMATATNCELKAATVDPTPSHEYRSGVFVDPLPPSAEMFKGKYSTKKKKQIRGRNGSRAGETTGHGFVCRSDIPKSRLNRQTNTPAAAIRSTTAVTRSQKSLDRSSSQVPTFNKLKRRHSQLKSRQYGGPLPARNPLIVKTPPPRRHLSGTTPYLSGTRVGKLRSPPSTLTQTPSDCASASACGGGIWRHRQKRERLSTPKLNTGGDIRVAVVFGTDVPTPRAKRCKIATTPSSMRLPPPMLRTLSPKSTSSVDSFDLRLMATPHTQQQQTESMSDASVDSFDLTIVAHGNTNTIDVYSFNEANVQ
jgi:hypothetical protein